MSTLTVINIKDVISARESSIEARISVKVEATIQLSEAGQCSRSHPHNEVLVLKSVVVLVVRVELPKVASPCKRAIELFGENGLQVTRRVPELNLLIRWPRNASVFQRNETIAYRVQCQCIVEQRVCNSTARHCGLASRANIERHAIGRNFSAEITQQLIVVSGLHVSPMVLIKVRQPVVHEDVALELLVEVELDSTLARRARVVSDLISAGAVRNSQLVCYGIDFLTQRVVVNEFGNLRR